MLFIIIRITKGLLYLSRSIKKYRHLIRIVNLLHFELIFFEDVKARVSVQENGNIIALFIIFLVKSLQKEQKALIMEYKPQSAGINLQSLDSSDSTPWTLTQVKAYISSRIRFDSYSLR